MSTELTVTSLAENEAIIERGMSTFIKVGEALARIREDQQYVDAGFETFQDYLAGRWEFSPDWAYKQIAASRVYTIVETAGLPAPANENVARQLATVYSRAAGVQRGTGDAEAPEAGEAAVVAAWQAAIERNEKENAERAEGEKPAPITGKLVHSVAREPSADGASAGTPNAAELLGRVGDLLRNAERQMDRTTKGSTRRPGERVRAQAREYSEAAMSLAKRLADFGAE